MIDYIQLAAGVNLTLKAFLFEMLIKSKVFFDVIFPHYNKTDTIGKAIFLIYTHRKKRPCFFLISLRNPDLFDLRRVKKNVTYKYCCFMTET